MIADSVGRHGDTELIFVELGTKVNSAYYQDELLAKHMLPAIRQIARDQFILQQDSSSTHRAGDTVDFLRRSMPQFITPDLGSPNSSDLNPVEYKIGGVMQERVNAQDSDPRPGRSEVMSDCRVVRSATECRRRRC